MVIDQVDIADEYFENPDIDEEDVSPDEYDIISSPNDWNFTTIVSFIESGAIEIPNFQRNYVWDIRRASKLIESLLIGLPVPQVFLYEEAKNKFLVIDGQQRLLSLYFFARGKFPQRDKAGRLRESLIDEMSLSDDLLRDPRYFGTFRLKLSKKIGGERNRFDGLTYNELADDKTVLDLRTIRCIIVKQTRPSGNSAIFEIFNRLNSGGTNLSPQEIRFSLFHSPFISDVIALNGWNDWRHILEIPDPDVQMRDTEHLLRAIALAYSEKKVGQSMRKFINDFCETAKDFTSGQNNAILRTVREFISLFESDASPFTKDGKFNQLLFESVFAAWVHAGKPEVNVLLLRQKINEIKHNPAFLETTQVSSSKPHNVRARLVLMANLIRASTS